MSVQDTHVHSTNVHLRLYDEGAAVESGGGHEGVVEGQDVRGPQVPHLREDCVARLRVQVQEVRQAQEVQEVQELKQVQYAPVRAGDQHPRTTPRRQ